MKSTAVHVVFALGVLAISFLLFEQPWRWGAERRLDATRRDLASQIRQHVREPSGEQTQNLANCLAGLTLQNAALGGLTICDARLFTKYDEKGNSLFVIYWTEDYPTPDAVRIIYQNGQTVDLPMPSDNLAQNQDIAKREVLYEASLQFTPGSPDQKRLIESPSLSATLLKSGKVTCEPWPVRIVQ